MDLLVSGAAAFVLSCAAASLLAAAFYLRGLAPPSEASEAAVTAILPATGSLPRLESLIADLARQSLPPRRLIIAVESETDPAYERARSVQAATANLRIDLVVAGLAADIGQKNANILAALKELGPADTFVLLMDADIRPQPWYVASLFERLISGRHDLVNGYRWLTPARPALFASLIAALDRRIAVLPRPPEAKLIWGGSIALTARSLAALDLPATLAGQISDDLPIGLRAAAIGLNCWPRRVARAPTPIDDNPRHLWNFARRQLQLLGLYRPGLWSFALAVAAIDLFGRLLLIGKAAQAAPQFSAALAALCALAALDLISAELRLRASRLVGVADPRGFRSLNRLFALTLLPLPILWSALLFASASAGKIAWAHVTYTINRRHSGGRVAHLERVSADGQGPPHAEGDLGRKGKTAVAPAGARQAVSPCD